MLDVGCGSGILGLCAVRLGATEVVAVDLKAEAVRATLRNADLNGMADRVRASTDRLDQLGGDFDIVVANIARAGIVELASELVGRLHEDRWLAVSGISPSQCDQVTGYLRPLTEVARTVDGDWAALVLGVG